MSDERRLLIFTTHDDRSMAHYVENALETAARNGEIHVDALALVEKDLNGSVHLHEAGDLSARQGAIRGGIAGAIFGLIFPPSIIASTIVAAGIGALIAKLRDTGFPTGELEGVGADLQPGEFAVLFLGRERDRDVVYQYLVDARKITEKTFSGKLVDAIPRT
jgi:uncharacterized membrane protein